MSNLTVRKEAETRAARPARWEQDPFRMMQRLLRWDPFREIEPLAAFADMPSFMPAFEVKESNGSYLFKADVPGVKEQDIDVSLNGNRLTVSGKRDAEKEDKGDTYYTYERNYGSFQRSFTLPDGCDAGSIQANLKDGVLTLVVPKKPEAQPRKIELKSGTPAKA